MFKKALSLSLIVLMLFSCLANTNATTLTVHARNQDNDDNGWVIFKDINNKEIGKHWIDKDYTRIFDLSNVDHVEFQSVGRSSWYNALLGHLTEFRNDYPNGDIPADVNFYKGLTATNKLFLGFPIYGRNYPGDNYKFIPAWNALMAAYWYQNIPIFHPTGALKSPIGWKGHRYNAYPAVYN